MSALASEWVDAVDVPASNAVVYFVVSLFGVIAVILLSWC